MTSMTELKKLYELDDSQWLEETINLLANKNFQQLDLENLIEELEELAREKKNTVASLLEQVLRHLLLLEHLTTAWEDDRVHLQEEIYNFRIQLKRRMTANLRNFLESELDNIYQDAWGFVKIKTQNTVQFPPECPYNLEQLLAIDWLPN